MSSLPEIKEATHQSPESPQDFTIRYKDISNFTVLGEGSFGKVFRADYLGTDVAVKQCFEHIANSTQDLPPGWDFHKYLLREVEMLKEARHPNIVQFMGACMDNGCYYIVTEFVPGGNLKDWILAENLAEHRNTSNQHLKSVRMRLGFGIDIARALAFLHAHSITHRDLKLENLLLTENNRVKVCDFGFSRILQPTSAANLRHERKLSYCGTEDYMAPELILCMEYDQSIDVFSYGIVLLSLITLLPPANAIFARMIPGFGLNFEAISEAIPLTFSNIPKVITLLKGCLEEDGAKRSGWKDVLSTLKDFETGYIDRLREIEPKLNPSTSMLNIGVIPTATQTEQHNSNNSLSDVTAGSPLAAPETAYAYSSSTAGTPTSPSPNPERSPSTQPRLQQMPHRFSIVFSSLNLMHPVKCHSCHKTINGFMHSHLQCDDCGLACHKKCAKFVQPACESRNEYHQPTVLRITPMPETAPRAAAKGPSPLVKKFDGNFLTVRPQ